MYDLSGIQDRLTIAVLDGIWKDKKCEINGNVEFRGVNTTHNAADNDPNWAIWKITRDGNGNKLREEGPLQGSWNARSSLGWDSYARKSFPILDKTAMYYGLRSSLEEITILLNKIETHLSILTKEEL